MQSIGAVAQSSKIAYGRIKDYVTQTLCLGSRVHEGLFFKTENFQKTGSFKFRGATAKLSSLGNDVPVITASSGNHGIAFSHATVTQSKKPLSHKKTQVAHGRAGRINNMSKEPQQKGGLKGGLKLYFQVMY